MISSNIARNNNKFEFEIVLFFMAAANQRSIVNEYVQIIGRIILHNISMATKQTMTSCIEKEGETNICDVISGSFF